MFDLNDNGKLDAWEWILMDDMDSDTDKALQREDPFEPADPDSDALSDETEELKEKLELFGLDYDELLYMDEDERKEALEDNGLDPDDFEDLFI